MYGGSAAGQRSTGRTATDVGDSVSSTQISAPRATGTALLAAYFTGWPEIAAWAWQKGNATPSP